MNGKEDAATGNPQCGQKVAPSDKVLAHLTHGIVVKLSFSKQEICQSIWASIAQDRPLARTGR